MGRLTDALTSVQNAGNSFLSGVGNSLRGIQAPSLQLPKQTTQSPNTEMDENKSFGQRLLQTITQHAANAQQFIESPRSSTELVTNAFNKMIPGLEPAATRKPNFNVDLPQNIMEALANVQKPIESGIKGVRDTGVGFARFLPDIIAKGVVDPSIDVGRVISSNLLGNSKTPTYNELKSPVAKTGYQIASGINPQETKNLGVNISPKEVIANIGGIADPIVSAAFLNAATNTGGKITLNTTKQALFEIAKKSAVEQGKQGILLGFVKGLQEAKTIDGVANYAMKIAEVTGKTAAISAAIGFALPYASYGAQKAVDIAKNTNVNDIPIGFKVKPISDADRAALNGPVPPNEAPVAPQQGSVEQIAETAGGWKPGTRQQFDSALLNKDAATVQKMLPDVPADYKARFASEIDNLVPNGSSIPTATAATDPVQKVMQALKEAEPIRKGQEALYSAERSKRFGEVAGIQSQLGGESGFHQELGALKGELPKADFQGIRNQLTQDDVDSLFNQVKSASGLMPGEKVTAQNGLAKLLGGEGGTVPTKGEITLLNQVFPPEFIQTVMDKRSFLQKALTVGDEVINVPKALLASTDVSAPMRQGWFILPRRLMTHPIETVGELKDMFKYAFSEDAYKGMLQDIQNDPNYQLMQQSKLAIADMDSPLLTGREEAFRSNLAEQIPVIGKIVKGSDRAYTGFLDKLRVDSFNDFIDTAKQSNTELTPDLLKGISDFVNAATGRGDLGALGPVSKYLNGAFFSPRLMASRIQLLNPVTYVKMPPLVRQEALKTLVSFVGTTVGAMSLAKLAGADVVTDSTNADFGKIKVGNTRFDIGGGFLQYLVAGSRLVQNKLTSSTTGKETVFNEGYKPTTRLDIIKRFFQSKESPIVSFALGLLSGQDNLGEDFKATPQLIDSFIPLVFQDLNDLYQDPKSAGILAALPAIFGVGVQTYGKQIPVKDVTTSGKPTITFRSPPDLGEIIVNALTGQKVTDFTPAQQESMAAQDLAKKKAQATKDKAAYELAQKRKAILKGQQPAASPLQFLQGLVPGFQAPPIQTPSGTTGRLRSTP